MSDIEQIDFSTLIWVKKELDETFNRAQAAIEEYVENPEDENQLQFCATYLHQVQGTLKMVELYGAAMVAEEMEQVVKKILNKEVDSEKDSFEVLMRGIILLPDYLERIQLGYKDIPMVLLPLVNDLRTVKGDQLLSESALFNPDLSLGLPENNLRSSFTLSQNQLVQVVKKIRSAYQICLLNWLKNIDVNANLKKIQIIVDKLKTVITPIEEKQLFWVAGGLFEALINGGLEESVTVKQLAAKLDQSIRMITDPNSKDENYFKELTNNLLYYVALSDSKDRRINEIQQFFNLSNFISDDKEIEHAQSSLSGKNRELLESVTSVIKEDLMTIQESLDLYNRNSQATSADLEGIIDSMRKISDTLGIIGVGVAREKIRDDIQLMEDGITGGDKLDNDAIMHIAETLLFVESSLDENILLLGDVKEKAPSDNENSVSSTEMKKIMDTLAKESISNLQKIKRNFIQYIEEPWKKETIESSPKLLKDISGALKMSGYNDVADQIDRIEDYTSNYMLNSDYKPTANQLNMLAESIASLEYYLEYLSDGVKGEERILELAKSNIESLFETIELAEKHKKQPENIDADLDSMSDEDFELEDEFDMEDDFDLGSSEDQHYDDLLAEEEHQEVEPEKSEESTQDISSQDESTLNKDIDTADIINEVVEDDISLDFIEEDKRPELYVSFSEETDDDIKEVFLEEIEEELEHLNSIFPRWIKNPDDQIELLREIRRIYHTLKGSGRLVGALAIGDYSWRIEDLTNLVLNDTQKLNSSYILVMKKSTEILPALFEALQNESVVPDGYYKILEAAEEVMSGNEITEEYFDIERIADIETTQELKVDENKTSEEVEDDVKSGMGSDEIEIPEDSKTKDMEADEKESDKEDESMDEDSSDSDLTVDPVFIEILQQEVEGHLSEIREYINGINDSGNKKSTEKFIRVVHTLNGAANMASVNSIVEMTTPLELAAKLTHELNIEFDDETVSNISSFTQEASGIMENLESKSESNANTSELNVFFTSLVDNLNDKKQALESIEEDDLSGEFDLSEFLDDTDEETIDKDDEISVEIDDSENETLDLDDFIDMEEGDKESDSIEIEHDIELEVSDEFSIDENELEDELDEDQLEEDLKVEPDDVDTIDFGLEDFETDSDEDTEVKEDEGLIEFDTTLEVDEKIDLDLDDNSLLDESENSEENDLLEFDLEDKNLDNEDDHSIDFDLDDVSFDVESEQLSDDNSDELTTDEPLEFDLSDDSLEEELSLEDLELDSEKGDEDSIEAAESFEDELEADFDILDEDDVSSDQDSSEAESSEEELEADLEIVDEDEVSSDQDSSDVESLEEELEADLEIVDEDKLSSDQDSSEVELLEEELEADLEIVDEDEVSSDQDSSDVESLEEELEADFDIEDEEKVTFNEDSIEAEISNEELDNASKDEIEKIEISAEEAFEDIISEEDLELETDEKLEELVSSIDDILEDVSSKEGLELASEEMVDESDEKLEDTSDKQDVEQINDVVEEDTTHIAASISTSYDDHDEDHDISNEFDDELLEIFQEEADDILDKTEHVLTDLEENPKDASLILALQRDLHTLKGGARMAGLENIGNLSHALESLLEIIGEENRTVDKNILDTIHETFDLLNNMKGQDDFGQTLNVDTTLERIKELVGLEDDVIPEESKLDLDYLVPIDPVESAQEVVTEEVDEVQTTKKKSNVLSGNQIKVNSELLDNLVNYAGEVSIYRSRLEQEVGSFRVNLSELGNTVARIKEQLRKLDAETEAQIISTFQTVDDDEGFDPLEMDRFSQLQQLSRSLTESVSDLTSIHSYLDDVARTSDNLLSQQSRVNTELQEGLMETRLVSFNSIVPRLRRLVRTTSKELNKPVKLEVKGAEGEMDKTVLEGVIAPLEHMLRNSLAHGIESDRNKANKSEQGSISIDVRREATEVVISISDDGAGINRKKVKQLAIKKGLINENAKISDENIDRLILNSGFSTVDEVSKLAGRGVGMDVVGNQINLLGGTLDIKSTPKQGTIFSIRLPYTLALSSALLVEIAETVFAIPVSGLEGIIRMSYNDFQQKVKDKDFTYEYANEEYQLQELNTLLDIDSEIVVENNQIPLVMIRSGDRGVALRVDNILGSREIVVKTVGSQISSVPGIFGATILGDGNVVLILDVIPLSRSYLDKLANADELLPIIEIEEIEKDPVIMIVDDSITMRKVGERILRRNDYDVTTAKDGLDALEQLDEVIPDVMLLDIEMPRMDGYELAIEMKKEEKYSKIPIIMITSRTGEKHRQKAMDLGVDRYLGKPYQEADLLENISELIEANKD